MKKSELVARCLLEARVVASEQDGLAIFHQTWRDHFSNLDRARWDTEVPDWLVKQQLDVARGSWRINVRLLIRDLTAGSQRRQIDHV
jgi:hypothetical protein